MFRGVVVDPKCCFVSLSGEVRAWINPNPKSNLLPTPLNSSLKSYTSPKRILRRVVEVVEGLTAAKIECGVFFNHLR